MVSILARCEDVVVMGLGDERLFVYGRRLRAVAQMHSRYLMRRWIGEPIAVFKWLFTLAEAGHTVEVGYPPPVVPDVSAP